MLDRFSIYAVLREHAVRYPMMQPQDAVKLVYQNEYGGGHMVHSSYLSFLRLRKELDTVKPKPGSLFAESIGDNLCRVNLAALERSPENIKRLNDAFVKSSRRVHGKQIEYFDKLTRLREVVGDGMFSFSIKDIDVYYSLYDREKFPVVSHSQIYRDLYHPAYRVILKKYLKNLKSL